jgi:hypothetical protein
MAEVVTYRRTTLQIYPTCKAEQLPLLTNGALLIEMIHRRKLPWYTEANSSTIFFAETEIDKLTLRCVVVELAWWPHL